MRIRRVVPLVVLCGCGREITAPTAEEVKQEASTEARPCVLEHVLYGNRGEVLTLRTPYAVCPPDSVIKAAGMRRMP